MLDKFLGFTSFWIARVTGTVDLDSIALSDVTLSYISGDLDAGSQLTLLNGSSLILICPQPGGADDVLGVKMPYSTTQGLYTPKLIEMQPRTPVVATQN